MGKLAGFHKGGAKGAREVPRAGSEGAGLGKGVRLRAAGCWIPPGLRLECALTVTARHSSRAGRGGRRWGAGPGDAGTTVGMGRAGRARTARWVELSGSLPPASSGGGFLPSLASSRRRGPGLCGSPLRLAARLCAERQMLSCLPQLAALAQSEQFQEAYWFPQKLVFKDHFLKNYYLHTTCGVTRSNCAGANIRQKC